jgi:hypothetical protein
LFERGTLAAVLRNELISIELPCKGEQLLRESFLTKQTIKVSAEQAENKKNNSHFITNKHEAKVCV